MLSDPAPALETSVSLDDNEDFAGSSSVATEDARTDADGLAEADAQALEEGLVVEKRDDVEADISVEALEEAEPRSKSEDGLSLTNIAQGARRNEGSRVSGGTKD